MFDVSKGTGEGINEAAVQLISSKITKSPIDSVKYYDLEFNTPSPMFYPLETALINQLIYFTGSYPLYSSTLFSNDLFKNTLISKTNSKFYNRIEKNFDLLLKYEEKYIFYSNQLSNQTFNLSKSNKIEKKIAAYKQLIIETAFSTQNIIMTSCFNSELNFIKTIESIEEFKNKLYNFENILISNDYYNYYNKFCCNISNKLVKKNKQITDLGSLNYVGTINMSLLDLEKITYNTNFFKKIFSKLKLLFEDSIREKTN